MIFAPASAAEKELLNPLDEAQAYWFKRAREERARAQACTDCSAAIAHWRMAEEYERRILLAASDAN